MIECKNIKKSFQQLQVLKGIDLQVASGHLVSIVGPSGAGKSTLLHILGTLDQPTSGEVLIDGQLLTNRPHKEIARFRNRHIGFIFQFHHLLPEFTALENICIPGFIAQRKEGEVASEAKLLLERLGMTERMHHKPGQLSGGEQQRVALARALINKPAILLADEPTGNLDHANAEQVLQLILAFKRDLNMTTLIVTHDPGIARQTDYSLVMQDGLIHQVSASI
ncbi:MAG TPA: ABC transporter ATP-binding protein [Saprospiraceae bacterium]|nr:ABC transporter ATP-binding protein [Saprospiraceae bacterium]